MRIVFVQTSIVIDIPEETAQGATSATTPAPKSIHPLTLLERVLKAAEMERTPTTKTTKEPFNFYGTFLT